MSRLQRKVLDKQHVKAAYEGFGSNFAPPLGASSLKINKTVKGRIALNKEHHTIENRHCPEFKSVIENKNIILKL